MEQLSLFDKQISDDWLWKFSDYPMLPKWLKWKIKKHIVKKRRLDL